MLEIYLPCYYLVAAPLRAAFFFLGNALHEKGRSGGLRYHNLHLRKTALWRRIQKLARLA